MPLPAGVETVTVSTGEPLTLPDGTWVKGEFTFAAPDLVIIGEDDFTFGGEVPAVLVDGETSATLVATDATGMSPTGWTYRVTGRFTNAPGWTRYISLPKATPEVVLSAVLVPDPVTGEYSTLVSLDGVTAADVGADPAGSAAAAQAASVAAAATDATTKVTAHAGAADPHGDRAAATDALATHEADTTSVHGIADTAALETAAGAQSKANAAQAAAISAAATDATTKAAAAQAAAIADALTKYLQLAGGTVTGPITSVRAASTDTALAGSVTGDAFDRVRILESGLLEIGTGAAARDTRLRRLGVGILGTDAAFEAGTTVTIGGGDPTADNHATRKSWVDQQNGWSLADYQAAGAGIKAWTGQPGYSTTGALTFGSIKLLKLWLRTAATLTTVNITITTAGSGLTADQNFVAILDASGNRVALSADQTTAFGSTGLKAVTMTTPYAAAAGGYYLAILSNGTTTAPNLACHGNSGSSMLSFGLATASARALQTATGQTSIPASIALGSQSLSSMNFMAVIT